MSSKSCIWVPLRDSFSNARIITKLNRILNEVSLEFLTLLMKYPHGFWTSQKCVLKHLNTLREAPFDWSIHSIETFFCRKFLKTFNDSRRKNKNANFCLRQSVAIYKNLESLTEISFSMCFLLQIIILLNLADQVLLVKIFCQNNNSAVVTVRKFRL